MTQPHRIALKGPWYFEWLSENAVSAAGDSVLSGGRLRMPIDWQSVFGASPGRVRFSRRFHRPTGLEADDRVLLTFAGIGGSAAVELNDKVLGGIQDAREPIAFDITHLLEPGNTIDVVVGYDPNSHGPLGGLWGAVCVEIHPATSPR